MELIPLQQWICDECGEIIEKLEDGWLEWVSSISENIPSHGFRIVHHATASPRASCYYPDNALVRNGHLHWYLGHDGLAQLLVFFHDGHRKAKDSAEVAEIIRRLHLPHYEEARLYFQTAHNDGYTEGFNEYRIYMQDAMRNIIRKYGNKD